MKKFLIALALTLCLGWVFYSIPFMLKNRDLDDNMMHGLIDGLVEEIIPVKIPGIRNAYNPGLISYQDHYLMVFRFDYPSTFSLERLQKERSPYIGLIELDKHFQPLGKYQLLNTRPKNPELTQRAEDPRLFTIDDRLYIIYNDKPRGERNDEIYMHLAEVFQDNGRFFLGPIHRLEPPNSKPFNAEKNWMPFSFQDKLHLIYTINPHVVLAVDHQTGDLDHVYENPAHFPWRHGEPRGGTPATLVDNEYITFFHSSVFAKPSWYKKRTGRVYFIGAYTFENKPPFKVNRMTPKPLTDKTFYTSNNRKKVIFPSGVHFDGINFYIAYGENDTAIKIAVINKEKLYKTLEPIRDL